MTFDLEKYEDAIMSQDDTRRINAGLELADIVPTLEPELLERYSQLIVDLLLKALRKTEWEFRNLISNALLVLGKQDFVAKSTWFWNKLIATYTDVDSGLRSSAMDLLKELGRSEFSLEILEPLIEGLRHSDKDMRILSANTLGRIRAKEVVPMLLDALDDDNTNVVYNVAECLGDIGDPRAVPKLMQLLVEHPDEWVHVATVEALGKIGDQRVVALLLSLVKQEFVVDPLIHALGVLGDSRAIPVLAHYLKDRDHEIRELAVKALVTIWEEADNIAEFTEVTYELDATRRILRQYLSAYIKNILLQDMADEQLPEDVRENCAVLLSCVGYQKALVPIVHLLESYPLSKKIIYALGQYRKQAFSHLAAYLDHQDFRVRQSVGLYLQHLVSDLEGYDSRIEQALLKLVEDDDPVLNQIAFETLRVFKSPSMIPALLTILQKVPEEYGETITEILASFPARRVALAIQSAMDEEDERTLPYFLKLLGHSRGHLDKLKRFFKHPNPLVQEASLLAVGYTGSEQGIPVLLTFIMSRQNSLARCAATQSVQRLIETLGEDLPTPRNIFDALFVMLNTCRNEEELALVAKALGSLCSFRYPGITEVNTAVVRGRLLDLIPLVSNDTKVQLLHSLRSLVDLSALEVIRDLRKLPSVEVQEMVASLYSQFELDLRVVADVADMISHADYSCRKFWILTAGALNAVALTDMLVPLLAQTDFRKEAFRALVAMGASVLPQLAKWLEHEDPRIQKVTALVLSRISQDHIDTFCHISTKSGTSRRL